MFLIYMKVILRSGTKKKGGGTGSEVRFRFLLLKISPGFQILDRPRSQFGDTSLVERVGMGRSRAR